MVATLSETEVQQRIKILKKLKHYLQEQKGRLQNYLRLLDEERTAIEEGDTVKLEVQVRLERNLVNDIQSFQNVIQPLEDMYKLNHQNDDSDVQSLRDSLSALKGKVAQHNERNRQLLDKKLRSIRAEIRQIRIPNNKRPSFAREERPSLIDIRT